MRAAVGSSAMVTVLALAELGDLAAALVWVLLGSVGAERPACGVDCVAALSKSSPIPILAACSGLSTRPAPELDVGLGAVPGAGVGVRVGRDRLAVAALSRVGAATELGVGFRTGVRLGIRLALAALAG